MPLSETIAFLRCVLPDEGYYCAVVLDPRPRQYFFSTIEELADAILWHDGQGRTVYHACASFKTADNRQGANARYSRSLWIDIDCGVGKPYADAQAGYEALGKFCANTGLPFPVVVGSGFGLHCYWPLGQDLLPAEWKRLSAGLKALSAQHGLQIDPVRTADIASILRTPGTHNRKNGERLVQVGPLISYGNRTFDCLSGASSAPAGIRYARVAPRLSVARSVSEAIDSDSPSAYEACFADWIADRCGQVARLRQSGNIPEPLWNACAAVLQRCEDGLEKWHAWSKNDFPEYDHDQAQRKIDRTASLSGATTCGQFNALDAEGCRGCEHFGRLGSPISLGARPPDTDRRSGLGGPEPSGKLPLPALRDPFRWGPRGQLTITSEDGNGDLVATTITDNPLYLLGVQTGELNRHSHSYEFKHHLPHEGASQFSLDAKVLFGSTGIAEMANMGVVIHDTKAFMNFVRYQVDQFNQEHATQTRYDQFGWKNDNSSFFYGRMLYTAGGPVAAIGAKEAEARAQWIGPRPKASLHAWTEAADSLFATQMEAIGSAVLASLAAPLMKFHAGDEGGAIIHLFTPESGFGKTTTLMGGWTVWGERHGLMLTNEDTKVAKPIVMGTLANLPIIYDELYDRDPEVIRKFVMMFTEGRDRLRGTTDGGIRHTKAMWQTVLLSAANRSLLEVLPTDGTDAAAFRVLELPCELTPDADKAKGDRLKRILSDNAGVAGDAFLRYLVVPEVLAWARAALDQYTREIWERTALGSAHRFRVRLVAGIIVAGVIAEKLGILNFNVGRIRDYLLRQLVATNNQGSVTNVPSLERATRALGEFLNEHYAETLVVPDKWRPKQPQMHPLVVPRGQLTVRYELNSKRVFIAEGAFRDWCTKKGMSPRIILGLLRDNNVIVDWKRMVTLSAGTSIPGAQISTIEANAEHPVMSGLALAVEQLKEQAS